MDQGLSEMKFLKNVPFQVKAVARPRYVFAGWENDDISDSITVNLTSDKTIEARFEISEEHSVENEITENTTLNLTDNPYVVSGDIIIHEGVTMKIEKGVTVLMPQDADIYVYGRLLINGTEDSPVTIKLNKKANATSWGAISFYNSTDTSKLVHLNLSGTRLGNDALNERAGINGNNSHVIMDHLTVTDFALPVDQHVNISVFNISGQLIETLVNRKISSGIRNIIWDAKKYSSGIYFYRIKTDLFSKTRKITIK